MKLALQHRRVAVPSACTPAPVRALLAPLVRRSTLIRSSDQGATTASEAVPPVAAAPPVDSEAPAVEVPAPSSVADEEPEVVFYEGSGSNAELAISLALAFTLIYAPLSMASLGRRLWISYKFTNKRLSVVNTSPLFKRQVDVSYRNIREIRAAPRALGLWGDMVIFLKDGSRLELVGLERYLEIKRYIEEQAFRM